MHIGDMNLNHRSSDRPDRILQGNGRMGIGPRIQDDAVRIKTHLLYLVYQLSFDVGLEIVYLYIRILFTESGKVVFKSTTAINGRFAVIIRKYQQYLRLEKALSPNTLDAYMTDLQKLLHFLEGENIEIPDVTPDDLQRFAAGLHDIGIHPRSQARILSGIKSFFHFLVIADYQEADPSELLEGPKIGFRLPEVLTVEEIDRIISTVQLRITRVGTV